MKDIIPVVHSGHPDVEEIIIRRGHVRYEPHTPGGVKVIFQIVARDDFASEVEEFYAV